MIPRGEGGGTSADLHARRLAAFYRRVGAGRPRRHLIRGAGWGIGSVGWTGLWVVAEATWGAVFGLAAAAVAAALSRRRGETVRTGGLRWIHRGRGAIEVELLGGGHTWRRDLKDVAEASQETGHGGWRAFEVEMVTAVFPVRWLRAWGFEIVDCGPWVRRAYGVVYGLGWTRWWVGACMRGKPRPRHRKGSCVRARHRMGAWMDVVMALPSGLRDAGSARDFGDDEVGTSRRDNATDRGVALGRGRARTRSRR